MVKTTGSRVSDGDMPEEWKIVSIKEDVVLKARIGWQGLTTAEYLDFGYARLITGTDFKNGAIDWMNCRYVEKERFDQDINIQIRPHDVLITKDGTIGKVAYVPEVDMPTTLNSGVFVIRPRKDGTYYPEYVYYVFRSDFFRTWLETLTAGSTIIHLYQKDLVNFSFKVPARIEEQKAIVGVLSEMDALIDSTGELIAKKQAIRDGMMDDLLTGKKRFPGFEGSGKTVVTEIGELPEGWEITVLGRYSKIYRGGSPRPIQNYLTDSRDGINWIKIGDVKPGAKYINETAEKIIPEGITFSRQVYQGDFVLSNSMSFGRPYILNVNGCIHDGWLVIQDYAKTYDREFLYYALGAKHTLDQYSSMAAGSSVQNLSKEKVAEVCILTPDIEKQKAIAGVLSEMDEEIGALKERLQKYRQIRDGMMDDLLTGRRRLPGFGNGQ